MLTDVKRVGPVGLERRRRSALGLLTLWIGAAFLAMAVITLVCLSSGLRLEDGYRAIAGATFGSLEGLAQMLTTCTPLILTGLSVAVARRMGLWNVGAEGQLFLGATFAVALALWYPDAPRPLLLLAMLAAGAAGGGAWALGPAMAKARLGINEIVTGLVFNIAAVLLVGFLTRGRWRDPLALGFPLTRGLSENAAMPSIPRTSVDGGLLLALGAALLVWLAFTWIPAWRRAAPVTAGSGEGGHGSARFGGVLLAMLAAGALAGVAGMLEVTGVTHRLHLDISPGYGYIAILVAALGRFTPAGVLVAAVPFAALLVAGDALQGLGLSPVVIRIAQGVIVAIAVAASILSRFGMRWVGPRTGMRVPGGG
jgi:ABC-type uncharacterized transport system permease subunit